MYNPKKIQREREELLKDDLVVILPKIRSVYNVGSVFRTGDCVAVNKIFITGWTATPENPKMKKVALGADESVPWEYAKSDWRLVDKLKKQGYQIIGLEYTDKSIDIRKIRGNLKYPVALILGNEVSGIPDYLLKRCDIVTHLPMYGIKESLNVASAFAIAIYYLRLFKN